MATPAWVKRQESKRACKIPLKVPPATSCLTKPFQGPVRWAVGETCDTPFQKEIKSAIWLHLCFSWWSCTSRSFQKLPVNKRKKTGIKMPYKVRTILFKYTSCFKNVPSDICDAAAQRAKTRMERRILGKSRAGSPGRSSWMKLHKAVIQKAS